MKTRKLSVVPPVVVTPEQKAERRAMDIAFVERRLSDQQISAAKAVEEWGAKFDKNPLHALEWADSVYEQAGKLHAWNHVTRVFLHVKEKEAAAHAEFGTTPDPVVMLTRCVELALEEVRHEITRGAKYPCHSTSNASRFTHEARLAGFAEAEERLRFALQDLQHLAAGGE